LVVETEKNEMGWACSLYGGGGDVHTGFWWGNPRERDYFEDPGIGHRWEDNIKMDLQEVGCWVMDWIKLAQDRQVAGTCRCNIETLVYIKCGEFLD
jgi:hypothetical protein